MTALNIGFAVTSVNANILLCY